MNNRKILVVGSKGKTGSRVEARLKAAGITTLGVSRSTSPAFDWLDASTWPAVLEGVTGAYLTYHPDLSVPSAENHIRSFCDLARQAGVEHLVLLSGRGEEGAAKAERALRESGVAWNILQASWFAQNFSESFFIDGILNGEMVLPAGSSAEPFIDIDDIADVAVATLLEAGLHNRKFELTGPDALTFKECIDQISAAAHFPIRLIEVPMNEYLSSLREQGLPDMMVELIGSLFADLFDGRNAHTAEGVREALGRPPRNFAEYVRKSTTAWVLSGEGRVA